MKVLSFFLLLLAAPCVTAQKETSSSNGIYASTAAKEKAALSNLNFYRLSNDEGLSQASANVIFKDSDGFIWIGTDDGLNRYDGKEVKSYYYRFNDTTTIAANEIYGICEDQKGRIWVGHFNSGISILDKKTEKFRRLASVPGKPGKLSSNHIYGMFCDKNGLIWARTIQGISSIHPLTLGVNNYNDPLYADALDANVDIREAGEQLWFGGESGGLLSVARNGKAALNNGWNKTLHGTAVYGIVVENANNLLVASNKGLFRVSLIQQSWDVKIIIIDTIAFGAASTLMKYGNSPYVWVGTEGNGIVIVDINEGRIVKTVRSQFIKDNLLSNTIFDIIQDEERNVFIATGRGVNVYSLYSRMFNNYENIFRNLPGFGHPVYAIHELNNGNLLIGTKHAGAYYFNTITHQIKPLIIPGVDQKCTVFHFNPFLNNQLLALTGKGVHAIIVDDNGNVTRGSPYRELDSLGNFGLTDFLVSNDSIAYIASFTEGFYKWNYKKHVLLQYKEDAQHSSRGPVHNQLMDLSLTKEGNVVVCTKNGLSIYYPAADTFMNMVPGSNYPYEIPSKNIKNAYDDGSKIWVSTYGSGVQLYDKKKQQFDPLTSKEGLPNDAIYCVVPDDSGRCWIATNNGLAAYNVKQKHMQVYTIHDGLPDNEFNAYAGNRGKSGLIYFSTLNGIVAINPALAAKNPYNPPIKLSYAGASNGTLDTSFITYTSDAIILPPGFNSVVLRFASLSYAAPEKNKYKVLLVGFDKGWQLLYDRNEVRYSKLPPGEYYFKAQGTNNSGLWSNNTLYQKITVLPFWYQTLWFKALVILLVAWLIYGFYEYRINQLLRVEKLRRKISSDLHDDIGATLSSINIYAELAKGDGDNREYINTIQQHTQNIIGNLDDLVWSINPKNDTIERLVERMHNFAVPFLTARKIKCEFLFEEDKEAVNITLDQRRNLYLALKEMVNNVVKHANSTGCKITIRKHKRRFIIEVQDNGSGFVVEKVSLQRNGLQNLQERARGYKGQFTITSKLYQGSKARFEVLI